MGWISDTIDCITGSMKNVGLNLGLKQIKHERRIKLLRHVLVITKHKMMAQKQALFVISSNEFKDDTISIEKSDTVHNYWRIQHSP